MVSVETIPWSNVNCFLIIPETPPRFSNVCFRSLKSVKCSPDVRQVFMLYNDDIFLLVGLAASQTLLTV